jgi:hypothetical protein
VFDESGQLAMDTNSFTYQVLWQGVIDFSGADAQLHDQHPGFQPGQLRVHDHSDQSAGRAIGRE